ncbi:MAG TPA: hypothetical protein IAB45_05440 [Candidatus Onthousia faecavium]|nr:hypothetical protein [Candidatus Onthousia faecavium]
MTRFKDEDYNTLVLTFDKNSDIVTFENDIKEAEELGLKYLFRVFVTYGRNTLPDYESKMEELNLYVDEFLKESSIKDVNYAASILGDFYPEAYVAAAEKRDNSDMVPVNLVSAISMREFKNKKNVKQNIKEFQ